MGWAGSSNWRKKNLSEETSWKEALDYLTMLSQVSMLQRQDDREQERTQKQAAVTDFKALSQHSPGGIEEIHNKLSQGSRSPGCDSKPGPSLSANHLTATLCARMWRPLKSAALEVRVLLEILQIIQFRRVLVPFSFTKSNCFVYCQFSPNHRNSVSGSFEYVTVRTIQKLVQLKESYFFVTRLVLR